MFGDLSHATGTAAYPHLSEMAEDPEALFHTPENLLRAPGLSPEEKKHLLESWAYDMKAMIRAGDENMCSATRRGGTSSIMLQDIFAAIEQLEQQGLESGRQK